MAVAVFAGPLADAAHLDFRFHMAGHLLLGMLAPVLGVRAEVTRADAAEVFDAIPDLHGGRAPKGSRRPTGC